MSHTKEQIIKMINLDEPDYPNIVKKLDETDIPVLTDLIKDPNPAIAVKAISCLGFLKTPSALKGLELASKEHSPVLRVAAAHSLKQMSNLPEAIQLIGNLLEDEDLGVKKFALKTVEFANIKGLKTNVEKVLQTETNEALKKLSEQVLKKM